MNRVVNTRVLGHPMNWLVVWSMLLLFFYTVHLLNHFMNGTMPGMNSGSSVAGPGTADPNDL